MPKHKTAIIIAYRNEPDLPNTIADVERQGNYHIYAEEDTAGQGPGRTRHRAICKARAEGCDGFIIIDAHMRFQPRAFQKMMQRARFIKRGIVCARCHHNESMSFDDSPYLGAKFTIRANNGLEKVALACQWNEEVPKTATIGGIMGACYAMTMDWYEAIGEPLRLLHSWGFDEEYLAACTYFAGGKCELSTAEVAHLYRNKGVANNTPQLNAKIWANRLQLLDMLPLAKQTRDDLYAWTCSSASVTVQWPLIHSFLDETRGDVDKLRAHLATFKQDERGFLGMARGYTECDEKLAQVKTERPAEIKPKEPPVIVRFEPPKEQCPDCGYLNPWKSTYGFRQQGNVWKKPVWCDRCGRRGQMIRV